MPNNDAQNQPYPGLRPYDGPDPFGRTVGDVVRPMMIQAGDRIRGLVDTMKNQNIMKMNGQQLQANYGQVPNILPPRPGQMQIKPDLDTQRGNAMAGLGLNDLGPEIPHPLRAGTHNPFY
jgi:hypothetical protein